ncbi:MAG: hypothetical protein AB1942_19965 [Pseudomonadota bacterium]
MSGFSLQRQLLAELQAGGAECCDLADRVGVSWEAADLALQALAGLNLVDAHDPPPPCTRREMRWFVLPGASDRYPAPTATSGRWDQAAIARDGAEHRAATAAYVAAVRRADQARRPTGRPQ